MAEVTGKTSIKIDELVNGTVISGSVDPDGNLILTTRGGAQIFAGTLTSARPLGDPWSATYAYRSGDIAGYVGSIWKAKADNTGKPPALFTSLWTRVMGEDSQDWISRDAFFDGDLFSTSWDPYAKSGNPTIGLTQVTGEFETGFQALKIGLAANESQGISGIEENLVHGGETITIKVRAKLSAVSSGTKIQGFLSQYSTSGSETIVGSSEGAQFPTTAWVTYTFTITTVNAKPRAVATLTSTAGSSPAVVLIDRIEISRTSTPTSSGGGVDIQVFQAGGTWNKLPGAVYVEAEVIGGGGAGGGAMLLTQNSQASIGSGGAAGDCAWGKFLASSLPVSVPVIVGAGGSPVQADNGSSGVASSFYSLSAQGGIGGLMNPRVTNPFAIEGPSNTGVSSGQLIIPGGPGGLALFMGSFGNIIGMSGKGGDSAKGIGGKQRASQGANGLAGTGYGSGGSGAINSGSVSLSQNRPGGPGAPGIVVVRTYF